jgi:hypothetical protein
MQMFKRVSVRRMYCEKNQNWTGDCQRDSVDGQDGGSDVSAHSDLGAVAKRVGLQSRRR